MTEITEILDLFAPISLEEMDAVKLLDRVDLKFMFHSGQLKDILLKSSGEYNVLSIGVHTFSRYETHYFDTPDLQMYLQHHNGKLNRHKVRFRDYTDSGISFFEIKFKTNKGRTIKCRMSTKSPIHTIDGESSHLLERKTRFQAEMLCEAIQVNYNRITLVRKDMTERLTIDFELNFRMDDKKKAFPKLIIAEVKQDRSSKSPFIALMREQHIRTHSMSKYCLGIASLNSEVKSNNFKSKLLDIKKIVP